jgi:hypothetical protein
MEHHVLRTPGPKRTNGFRPRVKPVVDDTQGLTLDPEFADDDLELAGVYHRAVRFPGDFTVTADSASGTSQTTEGLIRPWAYCIFRKER